MRKTWQDTALCSAVLGGEANWRGPHVTCAAASSTEQGCKQPSGEVVLHYNRKDGDYAAWGLHVWGDVECPSDWNTALMPAGEDDFGVFWRVQVSPATALAWAAGQQEGSGGAINFIVHRGDEKDCEGSLPLPPILQAKHGSEAAALSKEVWLASGRSETFGELPDLESLPQGNLSLARAFWVSERILASDWPMDEGQQFHLHYSWQGCLTITGAGVTSSSETDEFGAIPLVPTQLPQVVKDNFPHIAQFSGLQLPLDIDINRFIKCQLALACTSASGSPLDATSLQLQAVLDDAFSCETGPLGVEFEKADETAESEATKKSEGREKERVKLHLWAPTAQSVHLLLYASPSPSSSPSHRIPMEEGRQGRRGVWSAEGLRKEWLGLFYLFEVVVYHPVTGKIETSRSTDPYSRGLSANGCLSLICDLSLPDTAPLHWSSLAEVKPPLSSHVDASIYELHIRDFSASDPSVPTHLRGTFLAFTQEESLGMTHLKSLASAGLSHLHLLPSFDFGSVDERKEAWKTVDEDKLLLYPPDSDQQQAAVVAIQNEDAYNWGYDPVHFGVPDGSYATLPDGTGRSLEFRSMVQSLNRIGLRVVLDVVYNHMYGSGPQSRLSNLDKVVPGYYLRRDVDGRVESSTCMNNTASEHKMMERLIVDDVVHWAKTYKVDGFRFDLMGHLMKRTMLRVRAALNQLTIEKDGVHGPAIIMYGEGWDFGEVAGNRRGVNGSQMNLAGTGVGNFNDRLRDKALGGSPFAPPLLQGFITGLFDESNEWECGNDSQEMQRSRLLLDADWLKLALAGNIRSFEIETAGGEKLLGASLLTHDAIPVAVAAEPAETVNYVSAHDNQTLFDIITIKAAAGVSPQQRVRMNFLATSLVALGQGIPFFHAGDELLRSKSLDRDSYNSGDWFNRLDFSYTSNNFAVGLPPREKNEANWPLMRTLLSNANLIPSKDDITAATNNFRTLLTIRYSSPLFRLQTAADINERVSFLLNGPDAIPGIIVMMIVDGGAGGAPSGMQALDRRYKRILVVFNATSKATTISLPSLVGIKLQLHPAQQQGWDEVVKESSFDNKEAELKVGARTPTVMIESRL